MTTDLTLPMTTQTVSHVWKTTIQENIEGGEKRSALLTWPRVNLDNKIQMSEDNERSFIQASLWRDIDSLWNIPIISDKTLLTAQASSGQKIIAVSETDYRHFYDGRQAVLIDPDDWENYEIVSIDTVDSSTQITVVDNLVSTWPASTEIYPLYPCRIPKNQIRESRFKGIESIEITGQEAFETQRDFTYTLPTIDTNVYPVYNSLNLFLHCPRPPVKETYRFDYTLFGNIGLKTSFSTFDATRIMFDREFQLTAKKDIYDLLDFFDAKQGKLGTFYTPTWINDFVINAAAGPSDTTLTTKKIYLTESEIINRHVYIQLPDKTYVTRQITARPSETSITIDSAIGTAITSADLRQTLISFLYETRFNQDDISIEYVFKENIARVNLGFNSL